MTLLNLRNWVQLGNRYETEQIYVHTKTMIVDDLYALIGSADVNDRSMLGSRDSELSVLVMDNDVSHADVNGRGSHMEVRGFARKLRMDTGDRFDTDVRTGRQAQFTTGRARQHGGERGMSAREHFNTALIQRLVACMCGMVAWSGCSAQEANVPPGWRSDCVGRMQLNLPGPVDVAANSFKMLAAEYKEGSLQPRFEFADGQVAEHSVQSYDGLFFVSHPLRSIERQTLLTAAKQAQERAKAYAAMTKTDGDGKSLVFQRIDISPRVGYASQVSGDTDLTLALEQIVMRAIRHDLEGNLQTARDDLELKVSGIALRSLGELPKMPGVCFPQVFARDDNKQRRSIGVTYRLRDHPDVTIWLEDASPAGSVVKMPGGITINQDPDKLTAIYRTNQFWAQREQDVASYRSLWRGTMAVHIDGRKGLSSFVELTREDGTNDFGYLVVVRGDPDAIEDSPDLMLYVNRKAANAVAKGKRPIDKDEFLSMAQTIAASIKHRPMQ